MLGQILVSKEDNRASVHVPEAHIQFYIAKAGDDRWIVCAFRTDGYHGPTREEAIPTIEHLQLTHECVTEVEVSQHIIDFAVTSERHRQESVEGIAGILTEALAARDLEASFTEFMHLLAQQEQDPDFDEDTEHAIGEEVYKLITFSRGLQ